MTACELLEEIGFIPGEADSATAERIERVDGGGDIAQDMPIDIGPPGAGKIF